MESSKVSERMLILLFDTVTAQTLILFCKQLSRTRETSAHYVFAPSFKSNLYNSSMAIATNR